MYVMVIDMLPIKFSLDANNLKINKNIIQHLIAYVHGYLKHYLLLILFIAIFLLLASICIININERCTSLSPPV